MRFDWRFRLCRIRQLFLLKMGYTYDLMKIGKDCCGCGFIMDRPKPKLFPIGMNERGNIEFVCICHQCDLPYLIERFDWPQMAPVPLPTIAGFRKRHLKALKYRLGKVLGQTID
jgi:hypothetical protein